MNHRQTANDPGDCRDAQKALDLAPPGESETPAVAEANRHVSRCPACQAVIRRRARWDARLGEVCRGVSVPAGLSGRILEALEAADGASSGGMSSTEIVAHRPPAQRAPRTTHSPKLTADSANQPVSGPRSVDSIRWVPRRSRTWVIASAVCALVAGGAWFIAARPMVELDVLVARCAVDELDARELPITRDGAAPPLSGSLNGRIVFDAPRQFLSRRAAVYFFVLPATRNSEAVRGRLLVLPVSALVDPPAARAFLGGPALYPGRGFCASSWVEGNYAYICVVKGGDDVLQRLRPARAVAI